MRRSRKESYDPSLGPPLLPKPLTTDESWRRNWRQLKRPEDKTFWQNFVPTLNSIYQNKLYILALNNRRSAASNRSNASRVSSATRGIGANCKKTARRPILSEPSAQLSPSRWKPSRSRKPRWQCMSRRRKTSTKPCGFALSLPVDLAGAQPERNLSQFRDFLCRAGRFAQSAPSL